MARQGGHALLRLEEADLAGAEGAGGVVAGLDHRLADAVEVGLDRLDGAAFDLEAVAELRRDVLSRGEQAVEAALFGRRHVGLVGEGAGLSDELGALTL